MTLEKACMSQELTRIIERLNVKKTIYTSFTHSAVATVHEDDGQIALVPQRRTDGHMGTPHPSNV